jgi:uncharacterized protein (DUF1499 family)
MPLQIVGALVIVVLSLGVIKNNKTPNGLGVNNGKLAEISKKPNNVSSQTNEKEKYVEPLNFIDDLAKSKAKIINILNEYPGAKIIKNENNYIYAVFTTGTMKYKDDVEFYFDENSNVIHYRSSSRIGYSDMGLNRKRYNIIAQKYYK